MKRILALCVMATAMMLSANAQDKVDTLAPSAPPNAPPVMICRAEFFSPSDTTRGDLLFDETVTELQTNAPASDAPVFIIATPVPRFTFPPRDVIEPRMTPQPKRSEADEDSVAAGGANGDMSFRWTPAIKQSLLFLAVQHGYAVTQPKTRRDLKGPFFRDYFRSVKSLSKWDDGGRFFTNYIAHPLQGSFSGFIQIQNDPKGSGQRFGRSGAYWRSRMKAMAWSAAWSTQFEIGPVSQASIGNVGLHGKQTYVDMVMTPTAGTGLLVVEDAMDKYVIERIERNTSSFYLKIMSRMILNPTRSVANVLRFKKPWYRDPMLR